MRNAVRKSAPEVKSGRVQKKNNWEISPNYYDTPQHIPSIVRKRPGSGYRHVLKKRDMTDFIAILPDWPELSQGLNAIVLAPGEWGTAGYHVPGVVHVCAWKEDLWIDYKEGTEFLKEHLPIFERLGVPCKPTDDGYVRCQFNESTVRAYQLLHILLHELGHHHDRMTTKSQRHASRGEPYAEAYALRYEALIWDRYLNTFTLD